MWVRLGVLAEVVLVFEHGGWVAAVQLGTALHVGALVRVQRVVLRGVRLVVRGWWYAVGWCVLAGATLAAAPASR